MKVSSLVCLLIHPLVLVISLYDFSGLLPPDQVRGRQVAEAVQYLLILAWFYHLSGVISKLNQSPPAVKRRTINIRLNRAGARNGPEPLIVLGQQLTRLRERVTGDSPDWINALLQQAWLSSLPIFEDLVEKILPVVRKKLRALPIGVDLLLGDDFYLGRDPPRIELIKVQNEDEDDNKLIVDVDLSWTSNLSVDFLIGLDIYPFGKIPVSLNSLHTRIKAGIVVHLTGELPPLSCVEFSLLELPDLYWQLGGVGSLANISLVEDMIKELIREQISKFLLLPNKIMIPIPPDSELELPRPGGYVRVQVEECRNLEPRGSFFQRMFGRRSTRIQVSLGGEIFRSDDQANDISDPVFNFSCEIPAETPQGRMAHLAVLDGDTIIGSREIDLSEVVSGNRETDLVWKGLSGIASDVKMSTSWCPVREATEEEERLLSGVLTFTVLSLTCGSEIVPSIKLSVTAQAGVQSRNTWKSNSISSDCQAMQFGLGAPKKQKQALDLAMHGGGMLRFTECQEEEMEVSLTDKLTGQTWSKTFPLSFLKERRGESPLDMTLLQDNSEEAVIISFKFAFYCDI